MVLAALTMGNWYAYFLGVTSVLAGRQCLVDGRSDGRDPAGAAGVDAAQGRVAGAAQEGEGLSGVGRCNLFLLSKALSLHPARAHLCRGTAISHGNAFQPRPHAGEPSCRR